MTHTPVLDAPPGSPPMPGARVARSNVHALPSQSGFAHGNAAAIVSRRPRIVPTARDELAARRERAATERRAIQARALASMKALEQSQSIRVPRLLIALTGSLAAASLLHAVHRCSGQSAIDRSTPWVSVPTQVWLEQTGLAECEWLEAYSALRAMDFIRERTRWDPLCGEQVYEIAFVHGTYLKRFNQLQAAMEHQAARELQGQRTVQPGWLAGAEGGW
jgi:hypothetical protein